jgi:hypothetical protein
MTFPFTRDQFRHDLLERDGMVCLVERTSTHPHSAGSVHWEVVVLRANPERVGPDGKVWPAGERYPGANDWGERGWTYTSITDARQKYRALVAREPLPATQEVG